MKVTAVRSWWSQAANHLLARLLPGAPSNRAQDRSPNAASGLRSAPVESQFWADFARQSAPSGETPKTTPAIKPLNILVPTDFSPASFPALDCTLRIARQHPSQVTLLHAIHLNLTPFGSAHAARLKTSLCQEALAQADPILVSARKLGITAVCLLPEGPPAAMIARIAGQCQPDLIILTHSQRGALARMFGGRTVEHVVRSARCPVLVLPAA